MSATDMLALAERVTLAGGRDRELDAAIYNACVDDGGRWAFRVQDWSRLPGSRLSRYHDGWLVGKSGDDPYADDLPQYTYSLDAAMTLVPKGWAIERWMIWPGEMSHLTLLETQLDDAGNWSRSGGMKKVETQAHTPALALCAAALRARPLATQGETE